MATRNAVVTEARTWLGTRWRHQARVKGQGVDCLQLVIALAMELQLVQPGFDWNAYPEYHGYGRAPDAPLLLSGCDRFMDRIKKEDVLPGDILVFKFINEAQHFAVVTEINPIYILHAYAQIRKVVEHRLDEIWDARIVAAFRFRELD